ncbi:MAG TPA: inositol monophosphatase family protein [Candidatus Nanoarchaeia archaeon]|nr:inositol monophosphatase family protein [Candidatus Nanoarchaeia archaeon]
MSTEPEFFSETKLAIKAALNAGKEVLKIYNSEFTTTYKKDTTPITEADLKSNETIIKILELSGYYLLSEENIKDNYIENLPQKTSTKFWVVDPLDGTADFINKTGEFAVMIALVENRKPILGVIYQPVGDRLFVAQKNSGAFFKDKENWIKLKVNTLDKLKESKAVVSKNHLEEIEKDFLDIVGISSFSQKGSCGLKVAEICQQKAELYFTRTNKIKIWDTAAAYCLIIEAGGKMTDMLGEELNYDLAEIYHQKGVLVSNGIIHDEVSEQWSIFLEENTN